MTSTTASSEAAYRHHHHHHHQQYAPSPRSRRYVPAPTSSATLRGCCCCLLLLLILLALVAVAAALVVVLAVRPRKPEFGLQQVAVQYLLVSPPSSSSSSAYLSLNISLLFTAENPNKVRIQYGASEFYVMYRGVPLGVASVPGFDQPAHSARLVEATVAVSRVDVTQADAVELVQDAVIGDRVGLRITGDVGAKIQVLGFTSPRVQVSVDCAIVISPRKQSLTSKQCGVDGLNL